MWNTFQYYVDHIFYFLLFGKTPQEMIPLYLLAAGCIVLYYTVRMFRGETK